VARPNEHYMLD